VFGRTWHLPHWGSDQPHPQRRQIGLIVLAALLLATIALLLLPPHARGNFVYWASDGAGGSIGRAKINGSGANNAFIPGQNDPRAVAVDSKFIYWTNNTPASIGRANLDGSGVNPNFITTGLNSPWGIAVTQSNGIFWVNTTGVDTIGHANIDGSNPVASFITPAGTSTIGLAADQSFVYWLDSASSPTGRIGRGPVGGGTGDPNFITGIGTNEGMAVDPSFVYWTNDTTGIDRAPIGGGTPQANFIPNASTNPAEQRGVAVNSQFIFWSDAGNARIGRANINGSAINTNLAPASTQAASMAAAPSNKITVNSITKKKKKGTATINAKVPGPGQVTLNQVNTPPDVNATAAGVKQQGLTIPAASSFKLAVKPTGKTAKKLKKQVKKKGKGKVKVTVFIHFVPAGVAGVPNTDQLTVTLVKQGKKK
jgi:hypothetical protein